MKKRTKKKTTKRSYAGPTLMDRLPNNDIEHLELMISITEKVTRNIPADQYLRDQAVRLKRKLEYWKKSSLT